MHRAGVKAQPACKNYNCDSHNIETEQRLSQAVRRSSGCDLPLWVLSWAKAPAIPTQLGLMLRGLNLGHGKTGQEMIKALEDLHSVGCDRLTLGQ